LPLSPALHPTKQTARRELERVMNANRSHASRQTDEFDSSPA
jgi:hypothetical protein